MQRDDEGVWQRQSCSLCHVHTAYDGRQREEVEETGRPSRVWAFVVWLRKEDLIHKTGSLESWKKCSSLHSSRDDAAVVTVTAAPLYPSLISLFLGLVCRCKCGKRITSCRHRLCSIRRERYTRKQRASGLLKYSVSPAREREPVPEEGVSHKSSTWTSDAVGEWRQDRRGWAQFNVMYNLTQLGMHAYTHTHTHTKHRHTGPSSEGRVCLWSTW